MNGPYDDIIDMPHHVSPTRPRMSMMDRAAQFSPFAALTGYDAVIEESGRMTDPYIDLGEDGKAVLNEKLRWISEQLDRQPEITITYFQPDERKQGGAYVSVTGKAVKIDAYAQTIVMAEGVAVPFNQIYDIREVSDDA